MELILKWVTELVEALYARECWGTYWEAWQVGPGSFPWALSVLMVGEWGSEFPLPGQGHCVGYEFAHLCVLAHVTLFSSQLTTWNTFKEMKSVDKTKRQTWEPFLSARNLAYISSRRFSKTQSSRMIVPKGDEGFWKLRPSSIADCPWHLEILVARGLWNIRVEHRGSAAYSCLLTFSLFPHPLFFESQRHVPDSWTWHGEE